MNEWINEWNIRIITYIYTFSRPFYPKWLTKEEQKQFVTITAVRIMSNGKNIEGIKNRLYIFFAT